MPRKTGNNNSNERQGSHSTLRTSHSALEQRVTDRQRQIYDFIHTTQAARGIPPSMREIGEEFGIRSTNGVEGHLAALEADGLISRERGKSRGISVHMAERSVASVPLLGQGRGGHAGAVSGKPGGRRHGRSFSLLSPERRQSLRA